MASTPTCTSARKASRSAADIVPVDMRGVSRDAQREVAARRTAGTIVVVLLFAIEVVVAVALAALVAILVGPSRRVRAETGMDDEVETRILLGLDPEPA